MGLGAYWSVVGNKGEDVQAACPFIPITNGGAYTAGSVKQAVPVVFQKLRARGVEPEQATAAVVGANGVVGFGICRQLAGQVARLILIGTDVQRLEKSASLLRRRLKEAEVVTSVSVADCRSADVIFTATSTVEPVLFAEHVKPDAVVYDLGRPADVDESVLEVPGVAVIPGGVVLPPGVMQQRLDTHFGWGRIPACMAETILIALDECYDRVSLGERTKSENIDYFVELAERYGFELVDEVARPATKPAPLGQAQLTPAN
jgi:predicted amino acid dehydrogenase